MEDISTASNVAVELGKTEQALVYFPGDGMPLVLEDSMSRADLLEYVSAPVARAVLIARLRTFADMLEPSPLDALLATAEVTR